MFFGDFTFELFARTYLKSKHFGVSYSMDHESSFVSCCSFGFQHNTWGVLGGLFTQSSNTPTFNFPTFTHLSPPPFCGLHFSLEPISSPTQQPQQPRSTKVIDALMFKYCKTRLYNLNLPIPCGTWIAISCTWSLISLIESVLFHLHTPLSPFCLIKFQEIFKFWIQPPSPFLLVVIVLPFPTTPSSRWSLAFLLSTRLVRTLKPSFVLFCLFVCWTFFPSFYND
jgi:hypothetical protein